MIRALLITLCLASTALAELRVEVKPLFSVQTIVPTITTQLQLSDGTPIGPPATVQGDEQVGAKSPAAAIVLSSDRDLNDTQNVLVRTRCNTATFSRLSPDTLFTDTPGKHLVLVMVLAQNPLGWDEQVVTVEVGPPAPPPLPPPPPIPNDRFDNIGQRVYVWAVSIPEADRKTAGSIYAKYATYLLTTPSATIESASTMLVAELDRMSNAQIHKAYRDNVNVDAQQRNPWTMQDAADYWRAIAIGLGYSQQIQSVQTVCGPHGPCEVQIRSFSK